MNIEVIHEESVKKYMGLLTADEILGLEEDRFSCIGAYDEESGEALGIVTAQIQPRHITITRLFTAPEKRRMGVATALLDFITKLPEGVRMTFYVIATEAEADTDFLLKRGFTEARSKYSYLSCKLENFAGNAEVNKKDGVDIVTIDRVDPKFLSEYIYEHKPDTFFQLPEPELDMERFSDGSLCFVKDKKICGVMLLEEAENYNLISMVRYEDEESYDQLFAVMRMVLDSEYAPSSEIRLLICDEKEREAFGGFFEQSSELPVKIFKKR
ncbi:MAG: GNAT family N-acetyltransferase [Lachnospiraceae bacterium]|nr:GNAT family N-acetyltransferase [Lachnospiraceae bacterium]